jgi:hypothetical protein
VLSALVRSCDAIGQASIPSMGPSLVVIGKGSVVAEEVTREATRGLANAERSDKCR